MIDEAKSLFLELFGSTTILHENAKKKGIKREQFSIFFPPETVYFGEFHLVIETC